VERLRPELIAELACATLELGVFEREVLALLERHIGADVCFFCGGADISTVALGLDERVRPQARERWAEMSLEVARLVPAARCSGGVVVDSEVLGAELTRCVYYDTIMRPHRGRTTLMGFLECKGQLFGELVLGRTVRSRDFQAGDTALLRELLPTLTLSQYSYRTSADEVSSAKRPAGPASSHWSVCAPPGVSARQLAEPLPRGAGADRLSAREREVLSYLHLGYTNQQIALALGSAPRTVRNQLSRVYEKLGVSNRAEAVGVSAFAARSLVPPR